jgi:hypothetical protein
MPAEHVLVAEALELVNKDAQAVREGSTYFRRAPHSSAATGG